MKIWLNEQYAIEKTDSNNLFGKGNDNFDFIEVYIPTAVYENDDVIPVFIFERADKKKYGEFAHNVGTWEQDGYKVFKHVLNGFVLAQKGNLDITIKLNFLKYVDEKRFIEKTKNLYIQGVVLNAIVVENEAFVLSNDPEAFLTSLKYLLNDLNARIESGDITASKAIADKNGNDITETYESKTDATAKLVEAKGYTETKVSELNTAISNEYATKQNVTDLESAVENGTVVANNANEAVSYRDDENNLVVIKDKIEEILYLIDEVTGTDLSGLYDQITKLENAWNNFMNGSESDDVIDTLNEIRNELASLDSLSNKALYNLGAYDTVSGNVITRRTGYINKDNITSYGINGHYPYSTFNIRGDFISNINNVGNIKSNKSITLYDLESDIVSVSYTSHFNSSEELDQFIRELEIQYETKSYYTEEIIENQPLITLDSQGSQWLTDEWKQGLQLLDCQITSNEVGNVVLGIVNLPKGTYTIRFRSNEAGSSGGRWLFKLNGENIFEDYLISDTTFTLEKDYIQAEVLAFINSENTNIKIMLVKGSKAYDYKPYNANKHITNFEAEFLKEESLKSANKFAWDKTCQIESTAEFQSFSKTDSSFTAVLYASNWLKLPTYLVGLTPNQTYTISAIIDKHGGIHNVGFRHSDEANEIALLRDATDGFLSLTFTPTENTYYLEFYCNYGTSNAGTVSFNNIMLNKGSKAQPYHEFEGSIVRTKELEEFKVEFNNNIESVEENVNNNTTQITNLNNSLTNVIKNYAVEKVIHSGSNAGAINNSAITKGKYIIGFKYAHTNEDGSTIETQVLYKEIEVIEGITLDYCFKLYFTTSNSDAASTYNDFETQIIAKVGSISCNDIATDFNSFYELYKIN